MAVKSNIAKVGLGLLSFLLVSALVALGVWQLSWWQWQDRILEQSRIVAASELATLTDIEAGLEYGFDVNVLRVKLNGFYRHDLERYISAQSNTGAPGYKVITPFIEDLGYVVLVDRGWVSEADRDPATRSDPRLPQGNISVTGITRLNVISRFAPRAEAQDKTWSWYDRTGLAMSLPEGIGETADGQAGLFAQLFVQIEADGEPGEGASPRIDELEIQPGTIYLMYAAIFFLLAAGLATGTVRYFWILRKKSRK